MAQYQSNLLAPTYVSKKKIAGESEAKLRERKFNINDLLLDRYFSFLAGTCTN